MDELRYNINRGADKSNVLLFRFSPRTNFSIAGGCLAVGCSSRKETTEGWGEYIYYLTTDISRLEFGSPIILLFNESQINEHLEEINQVLDQPISWEIEKDIYKEKVWKLKVKISNRYNRKQLLYILTRIRYLYEMPYNIILLEAFRLGDYFKDESLEERFIRVVNHLPINDLEYLKLPYKRFMWGIGKFYYYSRGIPKIVTEKEQEVKWEGLGYLKQQFRKLTPMNYSGLNGMYQVEINDILGKTRLPLTGNFGSYEFWMSEFESRLPYYLDDVENIKPLKMKGYKDYFTRPDREVCKEQDDFREFLSSEIRENSSN